MKEITLFSLWGIQNNIRRPLVLQLLVDSEHAKK